jgi:hypothetical protein
MLEGLQLDPALLHDSTNLLLSGDIAEAHTRFKLAKCRTPFFSKFFYTVGLGADLRPQPLILDDRVYRALDRLHSRRELDQYRYYSKSAWTADGYARYVLDLNEWALHLECRPDSVELFLFQEGAKLH